MPPQTRTTKPSPAQEAGPSASPVKEAGPSSMQSEIETQLESQLEAEAREAEAKELTKTEPAGERPSRPAMFGGLPLPVPGKLLAEPAGKRLLWLGGLGAMVTVGLLEWPVAVAVGAGSFIAERLARDSAREQSMQRAEQRPAPPRS